MHTTTEASGTSDNLQLYLNHFYLEADDTLIFLP